MAEDKETSQQSAGSVSNSFTKGMFKDYNDTFIGEGLYTHARNAVNNSHTGQVGVIGNEPSTLECVTLPYTLIGCIHLFDSEWAVFTTNNYNSEIGIFNEVECSYTKVVNSLCLNFKTTHLITGAFRQGADCKRLIYWDDGLNPSRVLNIDDVPYLYTEEVINGCIYKTYLPDLDCEAIRIAPLLKMPCLKLEKGKSAGTLPTGSYQVCMAYTINQIKFTDYMALSEVQSLFTHQSGAGESSLELKITGLDTSFDEFELVIISNINSQTVARSMGYYSVGQGTIFINTISPELITIPLSSIIFKSEHIEKSDATYSVNNYLLRVGAYTKFKFNYQLLANEITTKWVSVKYPANYYQKGGNNTGYMRDEVYSFFIRWVYNTGDVSESYHIPGRVASSKDKTANRTEDAFEVESGVSVSNWQVKNTGAITSTSSYNLSDGGIVIAEGNMAYWESEEIYPANTPEIWGNLCGKPIRHHKFPDESVHESVNIFSDSGQYINILGVRFENIKHPVDLDGNIITSIVGYEILRGSREGQKSIVAKGILNNMRTYSIPETETTGLFQNYPYNDLRADSYLTTKEQIGGETGQPNVSSPKMSGYKKDIFSFHSPETTFTRPYLAVNELKVYGEISGTSLGYFTIPYKHPKFKAVTDFASAIGSIVGVLTSLGILSTGVEIGATADKPIGLKIGPLPPFPAKTDPIGGASTSIIEPTSNIAYYTSVATWTANAATIAITISKFADLNKEKMLSLMLMLVPKKQYAAQYNSHGFYNTFLKATDGNARRLITESLYVDPVAQSFNLNYQINNINRSNFVAIELEKELDDPTKSDNSRFTLGESSSKKLNVNESRVISSHYGALKVAIPSQYGQLESIKQLPISNCVQSVFLDQLKYSSDVFFGGDIYINRFTEKNSMTFFTDWLFGQPDEYQYDYTMYQNVPYPRFWMVSTEYQGSEILNNASAWRALDLRSSSTIYIKSGYFYLFNSGIRDFFVESEVNLAYRDWEDEVEKRHYDPYKFSDLNLLFRSDYIKASNYYKYDYSLSVSKLYNNYVSWATMLPRSYDPAVADTCYKYIPYRVIYSLPQETENLSDNWRVFLANNYYDFDSQLTTVKQINKTGALFMLKNQSPMMFFGVDQLQTDANLKVTIGDAGLFNQALQNIVNSDDSYEYGSCQNKRATLGTKHGVFWVSQNQGKVFQYSNGLNEISDNGMKWWFAKYLPSQLLKVFPNYAYYDNPVAGIGVQMIYDNTNEIIYITKKDYKPIIDLSYEEETGRFYTQVFGPKTYHFLGDPYAFEDASWTISYDPKSKTWISFHDWIPSFLIPGKNHFMSVNMDSIWKHNERCDSYCNFYGEDYPWEVEFVSSTGQTVTTTRSVEYLLEAYKYYNDCKDKFHVLDRNFDEAIIYNSEQVSGMLQLVLRPKNNPVEMLKYPIVMNNSIDTLYSKEENKYRFNQFFDITSDRSEFMGQYTDPPNIPMFNTEPNGYKFEINPSYINYNKSPLERKKFRHHVNRVFLRRKHSYNIKFLFKLSNQKIQPSYR